MVVYPDMLQGGNTCVLLEECQAPCWEFPTLSPRWSHRTHTAQAEYIQFWIFCCHLPEKQSLHSPASIPSLCSHIYITVHEEYCSRPSSLYMWMYPWLLVPILGLNYNAVITTASVWGQCFSLFQGGCFRTVLSSCLRHLNGHLQLSLFTSREIIPYLGIFQLLWNLNRSGFPRKGQLTPLVDNRAVR